ncbi:DUF1349 domain-containing protein [Arthrobacter sp. SA17]
MTPYGSGRYRVERRRRKPRRGGDEVRARTDDEPWRLVRVAPLDPEAVVTAGPFCCVPSRDNLTVHFTSWRTSAADASWHPEV